MKRAEETTGTIDNLFRRESGRLVSVLVRIFGPHNLALAEDVVQDALCEALETWKLGSVPDNPGAWLIRVARNRAIDIIRRQQYFKSVSADLMTLLKSEETLVQTIDSLLFETEIQDDQLRMMFACCTPDIPKDSQVALMLRTLCGFGVGEIAHSYLVPEKTIEQRLVRARKVLRNQGSLLEISDDAQISERIGAVHETLYLLFNEGYHGSHEESTVREDLCAEAMRLCKMLVEYPRTNTPKGCALLALMCFHAARIETRIDSEGSLITLEFQDRSRWNTELISWGLHWLNESASGPEMSEFHLEAAIALEHCKADSLKNTDWAAIVSLYDALVLKNPSPVVALNRAIAIGQSRGPDAGLQALEKITRADMLENYPFLWAAYADFHSTLGNFPTAHKFLQKGLRCARGEAERKYFENKIRQAKTAQTIK
jgi:RNA polymerase sigma-70 factor (ECF subfamily)